MLSAALAMLVAIPLVPVDPADLDGLRWTSIVASGDSSVFMKAAKKGLQRQPRNALRGKLYVTPVGEQSMVAIIRGKQAFGPLLVPRVLGFGSGSFKTTNGTKTKYRGRVSLRVQEGGPVSGKLMLIMIRQRNRAASQAQLRHRSVSSLAPGAGWAVTD